jgi:hypothetical protein
VMAIGKYDIQCSRRNPIENISKYLQRKSRNPNETSLPCFLQFLECRNCLVNNLNKGKQLALLEIIWRKKFVIHFKPYFYILCFFPNNMKKKICKMKIYESSNIFTKITFFILVPPKSKS